MLCKMQKRDDQNCSYCHDETDYVEHFFFFCPAIRPFWDFINQYILLNYNVKIKISVSNALIGKQDRGNIDAHTLMKINHLILIAKMCISIYKKTQSQLPIARIFDYHMSLRKL